MVTVDINVLLAGFCCFERAWDHTCGFPKSPYFDGLKFSFVIKRPESGHRRL